MARIRSIKPEFWRDEKIASLRNRLAGFFFIGLWNVADDEGKFPLSAKSLALEMPIFRTKDVLTYLSDLSQVGLIRFSVCSQWGLITNWHHQKIDKPKAPRVKADSIQWLEVFNSSNSRDSSSNDRRLIGSDRIKDRIGSDQGVEKRHVVESSDSSTPENVVELKASRKPRKKKDGSIGTNELIAVYCQEWLMRYKGAQSSPTIMPADARRLKGLVETTNLERAKLLVRAYLQMPDQWYVTKRHDIQTLLANLNAVSLFADSGRMITRTEINRLEQTTTNQNTLQALREGKV